MEKTINNTYKIIDDTTDTHYMYLEGGKALSPSGKLLLYAEDINSLYNSVNRETMATALLPSSLDFTSVLIVITQDWLNFDIFSNNQDRATYYTSQYKNLAIAYNPNKNNSFCELLEIMLNDIHFGFEYSICNFNNRIPWEEQLFSYNVEQKQRLWWLKFLSTIKTDNVELPTIFESAESFIYVVVGDYHHIIGRNVSFGDWPEAIRVMIKNYD